MGVEHSNLEILKFTVNLEDGTTYDVQVKGNDDVKVEIPENTEYQMTIHFLVKEAELKDLSYKQSIKKFGIVMKTKTVEVGPEFQPREEPYLVTFAKDVTPGGMMTRGDFACTSTYTANGEVLFEAHWTLLITQK